MFRTMRNDGGDPVGIAGELLVTMWWKMQWGRWPAAQCSGTTSQPSNCCSFCMKVNNDARATADPCKSSHRSYPVTPSQHPLHPSTAGMGAWGCEWLLLSMVQRRFGVLGPLTGPSAVPLDDPKTERCQKPKSISSLDVLGQGISRTNDSPSLPALFVCPKSAVVQLAARESVRKGKAAGCTIQPAAPGTVSPSS